jgi:FAD/FMN-containing dehydrogenase
MRQHDVPEKQEIRGAMQKAPITGRVIWPGDPDFDTARTVYLRSINKRPAAIVRVANESDIFRVIRLARENVMELAVRSGGHSLIGHGLSDGGIVLDLSEMCRIEVDPRARTVTAQAGATAGQVTTATAAHGLAVGFGDSGTVGIGGITLGGGVGYLVRKYGLTIDDLLSADIVTADGNLLHIDAESHPDLFWAIRGGGGNFGVVTRFTYRLHEVNQVLGGVLILPATPDILQSVVDEADAAPEELSIIANAMRMPPMPFVPKEYHGQLGIMILPVYAGDVEKGQKVFAAFRKLGKPIVDMVQPMQYAQVYAMEGPHPVAAAMRNLFVDTIDIKTAQSIMDHLEASTAPMAAAQIRVLGGAMARVPEDATAFAHRKRRIMVNIATMYERLEEKNQHEEWASRFMSAIRQDGSGVYVNFLGNEGPARLREAYPGSTWGRLAAVKAEYDPGNFFRMNHNIPPA